VGGRGGGRGYDSKGPVASGEPMLEQLSKKQAAAKEKDQQCTEPSLLHRPSSPTGLSVTYRKEIGDQKWAGRRDWREAEVSSLSVCLSLFLNIKINN